MYNLHLLLIVTVYVLIAPAKSEQLNDSSEALSYKDLEEITHGKTIDSEFSEKLVKKHGDELLDLVFYQPPMTEDEMREQLFNAPIDKYNKHDLPVFQIFDKGKIETIKWIKKTDYLQYPVHPATLDVFAYLLTWTFGQEEALVYANEKLIESTSYAEENWDQIITFINIPLHKTGVFDESIVNLNKLPSRGRFEDNRRNIITAIASTKEDFKEGGLNQIYQFDKILAAIMEYKSSHKRYPESLFELVKSHKIKPQELIFTNKAGFQIIPDYLPIPLKNDPPKKSCVIRMSFTEDEKLIQGYTSGMIEIER